MEKVSTGSAGFGLNMENTMEGVMDQIITSDQRMGELVQLSKTVAQSKATVLIQGESGTGKEVMANLIHQSSSRQNRAFIAINCAAIPENLLESELFGYERGAFTGAITSKAGKFELANGGTLLLDEISEMDIRLQAKLLRVIQEGQVDRIGARRPVNVDVRIIATTNKNLAECVRRGTFREDLFYRLNVVNLTVPPLRERIGDVELLSKYFCRHYCEKNEKGMKEFDIGAVGMLNTHSWPGNVRELENVVERAVITSKDHTISPSDVHIPSAQESVGFIDSMSSDDRTSWAPGKTLNDVERDVILEALNFHKGNRTHTARALGISIRTLRNKLVDYRKIGIFA